MLRYELVCFDLWNTLIHESEPGALVAGRSAAVVRALAEVGVQVSDGSFRDAHRIVQTHFEDAWATNTQYTSDHAVGDLLTLLGVDNSHRELLQRAFDSGGGNSEVLLVDGAREVLESVSGGGAKVALICDVGLTPSTALEAWLTRFGLFEFFDCLGFSDRIGDYKPAPQMFHWVMTATGVDDASRCLHIGDRTRTDIAGARGVGMDSVRFTGVFEDPAVDPAPTRVARSLSDALRQVGDVSA